MTNPACTCGRPLVDSYYVVLSGALYKSCALCSRVAGEHVFHKLGAFGFWHVHPDDAKQPFPQSECIAAFRARTESAAIVEPSSMGRGELSEAMPSLPARGLRCSTCKQTPRSRHHDMIADLYDVARAEAAEFLAGDRPIGRQAASSSKRRRAPEVPVVEIKPVVSVLRRKPGQAAVAA